MKLDLLKKHVESYLKRISAAGDEYRKTRLERRARVAYYQSWTVDRLKESWPRSFEQFYPVR